MVAGSVSKERTGHPRRKFARDSELFLLHLLMVCVELNVQGGQHAGRQSRHREYLTTYAGVVRPVPVVLRLLRPNGLEVQRVTFCVLALGLGLIHFGIQRAFSWSAEQVGHKKGQSSLAAEDVSRIVEMLSLKLSDFLTVQADAEYLFMPHLRVQRATPHKRQGSRLECLGRRGR